MTDAHCHVTGGDPSVREFLIGRDFIGVHPWETLGNNRIIEYSNNRIDEIRRRLEVEAGLGVGEIGLDRLKEREISPQMREAFEAQLKLALEFNRPVVLHGAKCWGQVVKTLRQSIEQSNNLNTTLATLLRKATCGRWISPNNRTIPSFLFHGFSRSDGLIPDIVALNGFISVGPAVLNDHAVNYRELVKKIPLDRLLFETDRTPENAADCPSVREVAAAVATYRNMSLAELESLTDENAERFRCR